MSIGGTGGRIGLLATAALFVTLSCSPHSPAPQVEIVMPDLIGKYWSDAEPELRAAGWRGMLIKGPDVVAAQRDRNRILRQDPPRGARLGPDTVITVRFGSA